MFSTIKIGNYFFEIHLRAFQVYEIGFFFSYGDIHILLNPPQRLLKSILIKIIGYHQSLPLLGSFNPKFLDPLSMQVGINIPMGRHVPHR